MKLSPETGFKLVRLLVLITFLGSLLTALLFPTGFGEVYPFAAWKLYTQPLGSKQYYEEYRIYALLKEGSAYERQAVRTVAAFTRDEYVYTFNSLMQAALAGGQEAGKAKKSSRKFAQFVVNRLRHLF